MYKNKTYHIEETLGRLPHDFGVGKDFLKKIRKLPAIKKIVDTFGHFLIFFREWGLTK